MSHTFSAVYFTQYIIMQYVVVDSIIAYCIFFTIFSPFTFILLFPFITILYIMYFIIIIIIYLINYIKM